MNGVQTRFKCKLDVKRCKRFVFPPSSLLPRSNALKTKAIRYFQTDRTLTRIVSPPLDVASYAAMNPTAFCRFFKENTGKTFRQHITDMRIGYACKLLLNGKWNISEISLECGFESVAHFNRCFKKHTGMTPTSYRRKIQ